MTLINKSKNMTILQDLYEAKSFWSRTKGLLGRSSLGDQEGLWIRRCNSIHTFGMKFAIDCIFIDRQMCVKKICAEIKPFRLIWPVWGATSVIETAAGATTRLRIQKGDVLDVGN